MMRQLVEQESNPGIFHEDLVGKTKAS